MWPRPTRARARLNTRWSSTPKTTSARGCPKAPAASWSCRRPASSSSGPLPAGSSDPWRSAAPPPDAWSCATAAAQDGADRGIDLDLGHAVRAGGGGRRKDRLRPGPRNVPHLRGRFHARLGGPRGGLGDRLALGRRATQHRGEPHRPGRGAPPLSCRSGRRFPGAGLFGREELVDEPDRDRALAHRGGDPVHRPAADVSRGEDPGNAGLE